MTTSGNSNLIRVLHRAVAPEKACNNADYFICWFGNVPVTWKRRVMDLLQETRYRNLTLYFSDPCLTSICTQHIIIRKYFSKTKYIDVRSRCFQYVYFLTNIFRGQLKLGILWTNVVEISPLHVPSDKALVLSVYILVPHRKVVCPKL